MPMDLFPPYRAGGSRTAGQQQIGRIAAVKTGEKRALRDLNKPRCPKSVMPNKWAEQAEEQAEAPAVPMQRGATKIAKLAQR